jgi:hypothetical protein
MVSVPSVVGLEQESHNFLYEAKSFIRDALKAFNLLYGTGFVEASEYAQPKKKGLIFVSWAAENLRMPNFLRIVCVPRENRDANNPVKYVVDASEEAMQLIAKAAAQKDVQGGAQAPSSG